MNHRAWLLAILTLVLGSPTVWADTAYIDVVVTKDGNEYRGVILENKLNEYVRIEIAGGSVFRIGYDRVSALNREPAKAAVGAGSSSGATDEQMERTILKLERLPLAELKKITPASLGIEGWTLSDKAAVYSSTHKTGAPGAFLLNMILPFGIGSYLQGDAAAGTYQLLSTVGYLAVFASGSGTTTTYVDPVPGDPYQDEGYTTTDITPLGTAVTLNLAVAYITGLISPWTYEVSYNAQLKRTLRYY